MHAECKCSNTQGRFVCVFLPPQGLQEQLLSEVVRSERPDLEAQRDRLIVSLAADTRQLGDLEVGLHLCLRWWVCVLVAVCVCVCACVCCVCGVQRQE
jgi:hypothetical protein